MEPDAHRSMAAQIQNRIARLMPPPNTRIPIDPTTTIAEAARFVPIVTQHLVDTAVFCEHSAERIRQNAAELIASTSPQRYRSLINVAQTRTLEIISGAQDARTTLQQLKNLVYILHRLQGDPPVCPVITLWDADHAFRRIRDCLYYALEVIIPAFREAYRDFARDPAPGLAAPALPPPVFALHLHQLAAQPYSDNARLVAMINGHHPVDRTA